MELLQSALSIGTAGFVLSFGLSTVEAGGWNYNTSSHGGPEYWHETYTDCGGVMQSPIDIVKAKAVYSPSLNYFDLSDYARTRGVKMTLVNKGGHTVEVDYEGSHIIIKHGSLPDNYRLIQFHFHWGEKDDVGSEHFLDGKHFPMELHLVHYQIKLDNVSTAIVHPYGLAVLGFLFEVSPNNNTKLDALLKHFSKIQLPDNQAVITSFPVLDWLPGNADKLDFYRYYGSLTTPPCFETVIWSIATEYIPISEYQLNIFRNLYNEEHGRLINDFRPTQPLHHRTVLTTKKFSTLSGNIQSASTASAFLLHPLTLYCLFVLSCLPLILS